MARKRARRETSAKTVDVRASSTVDDLLSAALERGDGGFETGRYLITFKEGAAEGATESLGPEGLGMRVATARDFDDQAMSFEAVGDADAVVFPEVGVALVGAGALAERDLGVNAEIAADSPIESIEPEYFAFPQATRESLLRDPAEVPTRIDPLEYIRGFARAADVIASGLNVSEPGGTEAETEEEALVLGATWGLIRCKVPPSARSGVGIRVAVLDDGMDLGHPDFVGRTIVGRTFVGLPVQTLLNHGTHLIGTACGPKAPPGATPRYGIGYRAPIFVGRIVGNSGSTTTATVLAGLNWAIANRCVAILVAIGSPTPVSAAYTAAGQAALNRGCIIVAPSGSSGGPVGAPANSPTIMSVASLDPNLAPSPFSNFGKIDIAAPGRDIFSSVPRPRRYATSSGTSHAAAHVAGCAALWAETAPGMRGMVLWRKLLTSAKRLPYPPARVGAGLVQAP